MAVSALAAPWYTPYSPFGMNLSYLSTTTIGVSAGKCPNSSFENLIELSDAVVLNLALTGFGGLDKGTLAASTRYNIFAIASSDYPNVDNGMGHDPVNPYPPGVIFSVDSVPSLPFQYDMYRYIGAFYTDGSSLVVQFIQNGNGSSREMRYVTAVSELSGGTSATYANVDVATSIPRAGLVALLKLSVTPTAAADALHVLPYGVTATNGIAQITGDAAGVASTLNSLSCPTGSNSGVPTLQYKVTGTASISVQGYVDQI